MVSISEGDLSSQLKKLKRLTAVMNKSQAKELSRKVKILAGEVGGISNGFFIIFIILPFLWLFPHFFHDLLFFYKVRGVLSAVNLFIQ